MLPFDPRELVRAGGLAIAARAVVEPHVGETPAASNRATTIVLDASGSMAYRGGQRLSKCDYARQVAAALAYLMVLRRDAVGLVVHDRAVRQVVPPRATSRHLLGLIRGLEAVRPGGETAVAGVWHRIAARHLPRRGRAVLLSDGFDEPSHLLHALRDLRQRGHDVNFLHVLAPEEIDFPFDGPTCFRDLERPGEVIRGDARLAAEYRKNFAAYREALHRAARKFGARYEVVRTDVPLDVALRALLMQRPPG